MVIEFMVAADGSHRTAASVYPGDGAQSGAADL